MLLLALALLTRGPVLVGVTSESAWVAWETDAKQAGATVKLGTAAGAYPTTFQDDGYDMTHHVQLTGLLPGTTYHYIVDSDPQRADSTFTTPPPAPAHGPVLLARLGADPRRGAGHLRQDGPQHRPQARHHLRRADGMAQSRSRSGAGAAPDHLRLAAPRSGEPRRPAPGPRRLGSGEKSSDS